MKVNNHDWSFVTIKYRQNVDNNIEIINNFHCNKMFLLKNQCSDQSTI